LGLSVNKMCSGLFQSATWSASIFDGSTDLLLGDRSRLVSRSCYLGIAAIVADALANTTRVAAACSPSVGDATVTGARARGPGCPRCPLRVHVTHEQLQHSRCTSVMS